MITKERRLIKIQQPWWSAWKHFNWANNIWGVGINKKIIIRAITKHQMLRIRFLDFDFGHDFELSPVTARSYVLVHKTQYIAGKNTILYVVPQTLLEKITLDKQD